MIQKKNKIKKKYEMSVRYNLYSRNTVQFYYYYFLFAKGSVTLSSGIPPPPPVTATIELTGLLVMASTIT